MMLPATQTTRAVSRIFIFLAILRASGHDECRPARQKLLSWLPAGLNFVVAAGVAGYRKGRKVDLGDN